MIYLIKGADVYAPESLGTCDILCAGQSILKVAPHIELDGEDVTVIDGSACVAMPGMVDSLAHFSGGGGEGGFHTRTPEMTLTEATLAGVTTVIGALGTDATTRTLADLLAKARGLDNEGLSTFCYTGSYHVPARTITGSVMDDIVLLDKCIGFGEVAIADHRSSQPSAAELARIAAEARVGGMLAGKSGIVSVHVGDAPDRLCLLEELVSHSDIPASQFYPTHMNRNADLLAAGISWAKSGGFIDFTTSTNACYIDEGEIPAAEAVAQCLAQGVPVSQLSMSSDENASLAVFDNDGKLIGLEVGCVGSLHDSFCQLIQCNDVDVSAAVSVVSTSPADILGLPRKGRLQAGCDADITLLKKGDLCVDTVIARGQLMVKNGDALRKGTFE